MKFLQAGTGKAFSSKRKRGIRTLSALTEFIRQQGVCERCFGRRGIWLLLHLCFDITDLVKDGEKIITVRVDHHRQTPGGIQSRHFQKGLAFAKALRYVSAMTVFISPRQSRRTAGR